MAESYGVYDWRALPIRTVSALAAGLGENSRLKSKLRGDSVPLDTMLTAILIDRLTDIGVGLGIYKKDAPKMCDAILGTPEPVELVDRFETPQDFEARRSELISKIKR